MAVSEASAIRELQRRMDSQANVLESIYKQLSDALNRIEVLEKTPPKRNTLHLPQPAKEQ